MYIFAIFFAILPGFMISKGTVFQERFPHLYRGFDIDVYFLFIFYTLLLPLGLYTGRLIVKNFDTKIPSRSHPNKRMSMIIFGIIIYSILYFNWLDSIPLISAISEGLTKNQIGELRLNVTHQMSKHGEVPRIFGYWRAILQYISLSVFIYLFSARSKNFFDWLFVFFWGALVAFFLTYTTEKAPLIYMFIAIVFSLALQKKIQAKTIISSGVISFIILMIFYSAFMKVNLFESPKYILKRIALQTASMYHQVDYFQENGFTWFNSTHMNYLVENTISPNQISYIEMYPQNAEKGQIGSAGGLSIGKLFVGYSWFAIPLFFFITILYGALDGILLSTIYSKHNDKYSRWIHFAFYCGCSAFFIQALVSNVFTIFEIPTIVPRRLYPLAACYLFLIKLEALHIKILRK